MFRLWWLCAVISSSEVPNLWEIIEPIQSYMLSCSPEISIFNIRESNESCVEPLDTFAGTASQSGYDAWCYVDF